MIIGVSAGAIQGYFGGKTDLIFQRFMEIWSAVPTLYILIILASVIQPNFWWLLIILLLFSWMGYVGVVRAEFLRARNFDYVKAAKCLGMSNSRIIIKHLLPNAMVATITYLPFILAASVTTLTSLDFLLSKSFYTRAFPSASLRKFLPNHLCLIFAPLRVLGRQF